MAVSLTPNALGQAAPTAPEPFVWGAGGRRLTPEQIDRERQIANSLMQVDYSPIQSPWQGMARLAGNVEGILRDRSASRASGRNVAEGEAIMQALMSPGGEVPTPGGNPTTQNPMLTQAMMNPYLPEAVRGFAGKEYERRNPKANPTETQRTYEWMQGVNPEIATQYLRSQGASSVPQAIQLQRIIDNPASTPTDVETARSALTNITDPIVNIMTPQGPLIMPRSEALAYVGGQGGDDAPPAAPVGKLKPIGGATPSASGNFPGNQR